MRVLLVEDELQLAASITRGLEAEGIKRPTLQAPDPMAFGGPARATMTS